MPPKGASKKRKAEGDDVSSGAGAAGAGVVVATDDGAVSGGGGGAGGSGSGSTASGHTGQQQQQQQAPINVGILYPALKPPDGVALFRRDLQWDHLEDIFSSVAYRFTPPKYPDAWTALFPQDRSWSFAELFLDCIANSSKANKNLKDKMNDSTAFAVNFSKLCLLINVGRINTTLAFYPEMKTALRTYHPIPSMQLDEYSKKNLQDAPRMKAQLKGCHMPSEADNLPDSLAEVIRRATVVGWKPPTCVVQCIFLLFNEWSRITQKYFPEGITLYDLFWPGDPTNSVPSTQRCEAFLWLIYRFLETPHLVTEDFKSGEAKLPADQLLKLEKCDCSDENQDTPEELKFAEEMRTAREDFVKKYISEDSVLLAANASASKAPGASGHNTLSVEETKITKPSSRASTPLASSVAAPAATNSKQNRQAPISIDHLTTPIAGPSKLAQSSAVPSVTSEDAQSLHGSVQPGPPTSVASGSSTPTGTGSGTAMAVADAYVESAETYFPEIHQYTYAYSIETMREKRAETQVPRLVPIDEGIAEPEIAYQWGQYFQLAPKKERSLLLATWQKVKRDIEANRDPVYDSEEEPDWTLPELQPRLSGFLFRNYKRESKDVMRYQGSGPDLHPDLLSKHVQTMLDRASNGLQTTQGPEPAPIHSSPTPARVPTPPDDGTSSMPQHTDDEDRYASDGLSMTDGAVPMVIDILPEPTSITGHDRE